jgi:hypothetical protein
VLQFLGEEFDRLDRNHDGKVNNVEELERPRPWAPSDITIRRPEVAVADGRGQLSV